MRATPELSLHYAVAEMLERFAAPGVVWWHTPNGGRMTAQRGARLKRMGVKPGVADFILLTPSRKMPCMLELKSAKGKLSPAQVDFGLAVKLHGGLYEIARTQQEAEEYLLDIGAIHKVIPSDSRLSIRKRELA